MDGITLERQGLEEVLRTMAHGRRLIVIGDTPTQPSFENMTCSLAAQSLIRLPCPAFHPSTAADFATQSAGVDGMLAEVAGEYGGSIALPGDHLCASGTCIVELAGTYVYRDDGHFRRNLGTQVLASLEAATGLASVLNAP